jgi:hypothetical protein
MILPRILNNSITQPILGKLLYLSANLSGNKLFSDYLLERRNEMWRSKPVGCHSPNECEYTLMTNNNSLNDWKCCKYWQRKLSNKLYAKLFVQELGINTADLLWHGKNPKEIPFSSMPDEYVIKLSEGWSSHNVLPIMKKINLFTGKAMNVSEINSFISSRISSKEFRNSYIMVEELLKPNNNSLLPDDYKLFCFNGQVKFIQVINRIKNSHVWYSKSWELINDQMNLTYNFGIPETIPNNLTEIISTGEKLSKAYDYTFVRIDLYNTTKGVVFGEFTHTPWVGKSNKLFTPFANIQLGKLWRSVN